MGSARGFYKWMILLCLAALLSGCGAGGTASEDTAGVTAPPDVPAEDLAPKDGEDAADGLEGSYYNDFLRLTLTLDGRGGCVLTGGGADTEGVYTASEEGLILDFGSRRETATVDADGDVTVQGLTGYFLRDWEKWLITRSEAGLAEPEPPETGETVDYGDGVWRYRDFEAAVAVTYTAGMAVLRDPVLSAVVLSDGDGGFVTGRNVTELYKTSAGTDDEFMTDYIRNFVYADYRLLCGGLSGSDGLTLLHEDVAGRLAAAELTLETPEGNRTAVRCLLYSSTYADGDVNYICKTLFAPETDPDRLDALAAAAYDMGAVRLSAVG